MAFRKKIASTNIQTLNPKAKRKFVKGVKFNYNNRIWIVTEEIYSDNEDMRRIAADDGTNEIVRLKTLQKDVDDTVITFC